MWCATTHLQAQEAAVPGSADPAVIAPLAEHPRMRGEVRLHFEPRSSLHNTDGQVSSDVGVPAAPFMEDCDINRQGRHDTMENIDLDYGAALAVIAIETIARLAAAKAGAQARAPGTERQDTERAFTTGLG